MSEPGQLLLEVSADGCGQWRPLAILTLSQQPRRLGNDSEADGGAIVFRCCGPYSLIERPGADAEGTETIATLHEGDSYEMPIHTDSGRQFTARWRHLPA